MYGLPQKQVLRYHNGEHVAMGTCMGTIEHVWATLTMLVEKMVMLLLNIKKVAGLPAPGILWNIIT